MRRQGRRQVSIRMATAPDAPILGTWDDTHTYWCCMCKRRFYGSHIALGAYVRGMRRFICVYCEYTLLSRETEQ